MKTEPAAPSEADAGDYVPLSPHNSVSRLSKESTSRFNLFCLLKMCCSQQSEAEMAESSDEEYESMESEEEQETEEEVCIKSLLIY